MFFKVILKKITLEASDKRWETNRDSAPFKRMRPCNKHFPSFAIEKGCVCHWMSRCSDELCVCAFTCMMVWVFAHAYSPSGVCSHLLMCWTTEITPFLCRGTTSSHLSFLASVLLVCVCVRWHVCYVGSSECVLTLAALSGCPHCMTVKAVESTHSKKQYSVWICSGFPHFILYIIHERII